MGSIVSFPVLCIANAVVTKLSLEAAEDRTYRLDECPMLINGDDGLVRSQLSFNHYWRDWANSVGLSPSVGKTFDHAKYCNINSHGFDFDETEEGVKRFISIPYINMGLVRGNKRSGGETSIADIFSPEDNSNTVSTFGARHRELISNCPPDKRLYAHEMFLFYNRDKLERVREIPWYIHESLGGVGLHPITELANPDADVDDLKLQYCTTSDGHICGPSYTDSLIAMALLDRNTGKYHVNKLPTLQPIVVRPLWSNVVSSRYNIKAEDILDVHESALLDMSTIYLCPSEVMMKVGETQRCKSLRQNERVWGYYRGLFKDDYRRENDRFFFKVSGSNVTVKIQS
jgi:hypothetical protein